MASMEESLKPKHDTVMDVTEEQIARVYAKAFLGATEKSVDADGMVEELTSFSDDVLNRFPKFEQTLRSSLVSQEQKEGMLGRILQGKASKDVLNFLKVLSRHGRLGLVRQVARVVKSLHAQRRGMTDVEVRVAAPLDDATYAEILTQLRKSLGTEPVLTVKVNPTLLGGVVVRVGDRVYDGSVQSQLERTRVAIISKATQQIESRRDAFMTV
jgi:F-type H+-transporting ATPase subunit delta